jgi:hypothetical protein
MYTPADTSAAMMARNASATTIFMRAIIRRGVLRAGARR